MPQRSTSPARRCLIFLCVLLAGCATATHRTSVQVAPTGSVFYVVTTSGAQGGELHKLNLVTGEDEVLVHDVFADQLPTSLAGRQLLVAETSFSSAEPSTFGLQLVDLDNGGTSYIGRGIGGAAGPDGSLAYCNRGSLIVHTTTTSALEFHGVVSATSCVTLAWNDRGELAFIAADGPGSVLSLHIVKSGRQVEQVAISGAHTADNISWSRDDRSVAFESDGRLINVNLDKKTSAIGSQVDAPLYSPSVDGTLAWVDPSDMRALTVDVGLPDGPVKATIRLAASSSHAISWSPDGAWLGIASFNGNNVVTIWNWKNGERRELLRNSSLPKYQIIAPWLLWQ